MRDWGGDSVADQEEISYVDTYNCRGSGFR